MTEPMGSFLSTCMSVLPKPAICSEPALTTTSMAVERKRGSSGTEVLVAGGAVAWRLHPLYHADFHAAFRRGPHLDGVHEGANEKDAASARLQQVLGGQRIGEYGGIESCALVADPDRQLGLLGEGRRR